MGNAAKFVSKSLKPLKLKPSDGKPQTQDQNEGAYNEDVHEIVNLAFAIQNKEFIENMELWLSCEKLPKMDTFSLTDPLIVSYQWKDDGWQEIGRTEAIPESLNPKFVKTLLVSYSTDSHSQKRIRFEVYDIDFFEDVNNLQKQELIGYVEVDMREIVSEPNHTVSKPLVNPRSKRKKNGVLIVRGTEYDVTNSKYEFQFWGKDFAIRGDICLRFSLINEAKESIPFYTTDPEKNVKKGVVEWKAFQIPSTKFNDENVLIKIEAFEFNKSKGSLFLGEIEQTLTNLMENTTKNWIPFVKNGINIGSLNFKVNKTTKNTFLNYILGGTDVSLIVAIDFSKSNKDPNDPASLHYIGGDGENDYVHAMRDIIGFLQYYDHDNTIPVYGFGAKLPPYFDTVSHCFAVNGDFFNPEIPGIDEVIRQYQACVKQIKFHGPSAITDILKLANQYASAEVVDDKNQKYFILLIFSDGNFSDMTFTVNEIAKASHLPLSIIIVGMGSNDHTKIKNLDNDTFELPSKEQREKAVRDIVNSVEYSKNRDLEKLAKETLAEIPQQFLAYMNLHKIKPMKANQQLTSASHEFMHNKIEERKLNKFKEVQYQTKPFLLVKKEELINQLKSQNYNQNLINDILEEKGLAACDVNLAGQLISCEKGEIKPKGKIIIRPTDLPDDACQLIIKDPKVKNRFFKLKNKSGSNAKKARKKNDNYEATRRFLEGMEDEDFKGIQHDLPDVLRKAHIKMNCNVNASFDDEKYEGGIRKSSPKKLHKLILSSYQTQLRNFQRQENLCLKCRSEEIAAVFLPCGHAALCKDCCDNAGEELYCIVCRDIVESINFFTEEEMQIVEEEGQEEKPAEIIEVVRKDREKQPTLQRIVTLEEQEMEDKVRSRNVSEKEDKREETILHMDSSVSRHSMSHNTLMMRSLEKKMKVNRERNIMFSDSIGGNVFKDYEKRTESEISQQEEDIELEYLGI